MRAAPFQRLVAPLDEALLGEIARAPRGTGLGARRHPLPAAVARDEDAPADRPELRDELLTLLVAGHETTATTLAWALHHLARDRGAQDAPRGRRARVRRGGGRRDAAAAPARAPRRPAAQGADDDRRPRVARGRDRRASPSCCHRDPALHPEPGPSGPTGSSAGSRRAPGGCRSAAAYGAASARRSRSSRRPWCSSASRSGSSCARPRGAPSGSAVAGSCSSPTAARGWCSSREAGRRDRRAGRRGGGRR